MCANSLLAVFTLDNRVLSENHPMTLRQLHYTIFSAKKIDYDNTESDYKRLSRATTIARRTQRWCELHGRKLGIGRVIDGIPHDWIVDEVREAEKVDVWSRDASPDEPARISWFRR